MTSEDVQYETETQQETITVDPQVYERFEEKRKGTQNEHVPAMSESMLLSSLLDTVEAVERGYYDDD